jgi:hypothetical protein
MIKVMVPAMAKRVVDGSMQIFGGAGLSQDTPLAHVRSSEASAKYKRAKLGVRGEVESGGRVRPRRPQGGFGGSPPDDPSACPLPPQKGTPFLCALFALRLYHLQPPPTLTHRAHSSMRGRACSSSRTGPARCTSTASPSRSSGCRGRNASERVYKLASRRLCNFNFSEELMRSSTI